MSNPSKELSEEDAAEVTRTLHNMAVMPGWNTTANRAVARRLLESEWLFCNGDIRDIRVTHLGLGVYKVYTEARPL